MMMREANSKEKRCRSIGNGRSDEDEEREKVVSQEALDPQSPLSGKETMMGRGTKRM